MAGESSSAEGKPDESGGRRTGIAGVLGRYVPARSLARQARLTQARAQRRILRAAVFGVVLWLALTGVLTFQFLPSRYDLKVGDVSTYTIKSVQKITYVSQVQTREARLQASAAVPDVYVLNTNLADQQRQRAVEILRSIGDIRKSSGVIEGKRDAINKLTEVILPPATIDSILAIDDGEWLTVSTETLNVIERVMRNRITEQQLEEARAALPSRVDPTISPALSTIVSQLARNFVRPNFVLDVEVTARNKREAADRVEPIRINIEKGETILRDGDVVREVDIEKLFSTGLRSPTFRWNNVLAMALLAGLLVGILVAHIVVQHPGVADDSRGLLLLGLTIAITALAAKLTIAGRDVNTYYGYLFPAAAASMLIAVLLNLEVAFVATSVIAITMGLITSTPFESTALTLVGGAVGLLAVSRLERLTTVFRAGAYVSIANVLVNLGYYLFGTELDWQRIGLLAFVAVVNGLLSAGLALSAIYILGHAFGINTTIALLELAHPSHPLFRQLLSEAPGTYHHSVVLGNLSERAAEAIGADALLCRIGAYYHDIGKIARPYAFIENQVGGENIHDTLDPLTSARIVVSHVSDGLDLARRYGVPTRVQEMISQHHGTTTAGFFYRQACQGAEMPPDENLFRYPGPKPQSRETGIMMLADATEAAVRANKDHSPAAVDQVVRRIVQERVSSGQLSECDLTLRDLDRIRATFCAVLQGIYHPRIEYPPPQAGAATPQAERGGVAPAEQG
jgi:hypothetical protein